MTFNRDFDTYASVAKEHQEHILRLSAQYASRPDRPVRRTGSSVAVGVFLAVVCAPLAALFFIQVW